MVFVDVNPHVSFLPYRILLRMLVGNTIELCLIVQFSKINYIYGIAQDMILLLLLLLLLNKTIVQGLCNMQL